MIGPGKIEHLAEGVGPQAGIAVGAGQRTFDAHVGDLAHRAGGEAVATCLLTGEDLLVHQGHVPASLGQPVGARRARRTAPDDQDVMEVVRISDGRGGGADGSPEPGRIMAGVGAHGSQC